MTEDLVKIIIYLFAAIAILCVLTCIYLKLIFFSQPNQNNGISFQQSSVSAIDAPPSYANYHLNSIPTTSDKITIEDEKCLSYQEALANINQQLRF